MARSRRDNRATTDIWPGFVDALSTLLLVTIFLLSVFVLAQFFLGQLLAGRDERLSRLEGQLQTTTSELDSERARIDALRQRLAQLNNELGITSTERDAAESELARLREERGALSFRVERLLQDNAALERTLADAEVTMDADRATIEAQIAELLALRNDVVALRELRDRLEGEIATQAAVLARRDSEQADLAQALADREAAERALLEELGQVRDRSLALEAELAEARERTMAAQRAAQTATQETNRAHEAAMAALVAELEATRAQLARIETLLAEREALIEAQTIRIDDLDTRLAAVLAAEVDELERFRSDFFGRLREVLGDRPDVQIVGDRFVFQSEVLFGRAEATLGAEAQTQLRALASTLAAITADLPRDLPWILQINGHTDRIPISTARFPSNWELSTARAISVARFLIDEGIPAERVAAAGFAEYQPVDPADTSEAYRLNRRIEVKLTTR